MSDRQMIDGLENGHNPYWDDEDEALNPEAFATHPGVFLKASVLKDRRITQSALADAIMVARPGFNTMMSGKRSMTPLLAKKIERAIGYPAEVLMAMQTTYDLAQVDEEPLHRIQLIAA